MASVYEVWEMLYRLNNIKTALDAKEDEIFLHVFMRVNKDKVKNIKVVKKSIDARKKDNLCFVYAVEFECDDKLVVDNDLVEVVKEDSLDFSKVSWIYEDRPVVVGSGPSGMMAGLCLAEMGAKPIIIERGDSVDVRKSKVDRFWSEGVLDINSNVQFGEGGAGTFSDGKLMTGIKKDKFVAKVIKEFIENGAPDEISYLAKPHIGTDNLVNMVKNIRAKIARLGGEYRFREKLVDIDIENEELKAVIIEKEDGSLYKIDTNYLFQIGRAHV